MLTELQRIKDTWKDCKKCTLCAEGRKQVVFSDGPETARIMIVGEGPGATEDLKGLPFTGPAGMLMEQIIAVAGLKRGDCYWTNAVRCRPAGNHTPTKKEMDACRPLLQDEIRLLKPRVIIVTGLTAAKTLFDIKNGIGTVAGEWKDYQGIPAIIVYHPAAVLHTRERDPETCLKYRKSLMRSMEALKDFLGQPESQDKTKPVSSKVQAEFDF